MDEGIQCFERNKNWKKLSILHLNSTGLTDNGVKYLIDSIIPCLKIVHLRDNNFSSEVSHEFNAMEINGIIVDYDSNKKKGRKQGKPEEKKENNPAEEAQKAEGDNKGSTDQ